MSGLIIPDDWGGAEFCQMELLIPNSPKWRAAIKGALLNLAIAKLWDGETGDIDNAALIGEDIFNSIYIDCSQEVKTDEFNGSKLSPIWTWYAGLLGDPSPVVSNGELNLSVTDNSDHDVWEEGNFVNRIMQTVVDGDFMIEVKFNSIMDAKYQQRGVLVGNAAGDLLRLEQLWRDGEYRMLAAIIPAAGGAYNYHYITYGSDNPQFLRIQKTGDEWSIQFSTDQLGWVTREFTQLFDVSKIGLYCGNGRPDGSSDPPFHTVSIEYFRRLA